MNQANFLTFFWLTKKQNKPMQWFNTRHCAHYHQFNFQYFLRSISKQQLA